jgi:hypothetical protein
LSRLRHWWLRKTKQTDLSFEEWSFIMAFDQTNADIETLTTLANGVVATCQAATSAAKDAQASLAAGDSDISSKLQSVIAILQPFAPAATDPGTAPTS